MSIEIKPVETKKERKIFVKFSWEIYKDDPNWIPPLIIDRMTFLNPKKNPYFKYSKVRLLLAYKDNKLVGRLSVHENTNHNKKYNDKMGFFGFFECINDQNVANVLFDSGINWLKQQGLKHVRGPANFSINDEFALLIDGFDTPPCIMMTHNPPYYQDLLENYGFKKAHDLYAYDLYSDDDIPEIVKERAEITKKSGEYTFRTVKLKDFEKEVRKVHHIYSEAWKENWGSVAMTEDEFAHLAKDLKMIIDPDYVLIAEKHGQAVGFSVAIPDMNEAIKHANGRLFPFGLLKILWYKNKVKTVRIPLLGVLKEHRHKGIDSVFYYDTYHTALSKGATRGEASWILESNVPMNKALQRLGAKIYKTYRMYDFYIE